jgi:hypothetical protein
MHKQLTNGLRLTAVIPAKAGIQRPSGVSLDPGFRRDDKLVVGQFRNAQ